MDWTIEQVLALAPDDSSAKAGKSLAAARHWVTTGKKDLGLWGECQGSGSKPYQVQIDLGEPAFKCSCPSRKFPCKHGIGLLLLFAGDTAIPDAEPPGWVSEWLEKRQAKTEKKEAATKPDAEKTPDERAKAAVDQAKRAASRDKKVSQGLNDLDLWMCDLVRQGFGSLSARPFKFWDDMAARLVDAQAPGVARMVREMGGIAASGDGWQGRLLEQMGLTFLLIEGYRRIDTLTDANQSDIRDAIGFNVRQEELLAHAGETDTWQIVGQRVYDDEQLRVQRTYLLGLNTDRWAAIVHFAPLTAYAAATPKLDSTLTPGTAFAGTIVYFPSAAPLRAIIKERQTIPAIRPQDPGYATSRQMLSAYADALAANPWLPTFPALVRDVTPYQEHDRWYLQDRERNRLPVSSHFGGEWRLRALSGGEPLPGVFGEWDGKQLLPLRVFSHDDVVSF